MRFVHKYTGFIVMGVFLAIVIPAWIWYDDSLEFFERWGCEQINGDLLLGTTWGDNPAHDDLTDEQHIKLHEIYQECNDSFSDGVIPNHVKND